MEVAADHPGIVSREQRLDNRVLERRDGCVDGPGRIYGEAYGVSSGHEEPGGQRGLVQSIGVPVGLERWRLSGTPALEQGDVERVPERQVCQGGANGPTAIQRAREICIAEA